MKGTRETHFNYNLIKDKYKVESIDGKAWYYVAIIDYLQEWNCDKKSERFVKTSFLQAKGDGLSAI